MPMPSYYDTLQVKRTSTNEEIKAAYRKLALKWHPERAKDVPPMEAEAKFAEIAEAYEVLVHPARKAIYDQYGASGLKQGIPDGYGGLKGGAYRFGNNANEIFVRFFGTSSPFADIMGAMGQEPPPFYGELTGMVLPAIPKKPEADVRPLPVTLAELYNGAVKKVEYKRRVLQSDDTTAEELASLHITIKPGWDEGMPVVFPSAGDEGVGMETADVEFVVDTVADPAWSREGSTLFYTAEVSLTDALCGTVLAIPMLDGRTLSVPVTQIVTPGATQTVPGEGMPTEGGKCDLVIKFVTVFPKTLTLAQKAAVKKALA